MAYTCVRVTFEVGHEASIRTKKTSEGFTHDWELFVRGSDNTEIHHFVEKVIFHLHESFRNPKRVIKEPPFVVKESGYAGFPLPIDIYLKNKHEPSKIRFNYQLTLQEIGPAISNVRREKYVFKNPSEDFRRKLIRGGGVGVGADSASGSHTNHMAALNSDHSAEDHRNLVNKNKASPQDGIVAKKSKKENTPKNDELSANDPFAIFGQPIKTSKLQIVSKSSSKQQISDKAALPSEKQGHSSKSSKHSSSSHKDKDKDKERGDKDRPGSGTVVEKEKEKTKDKEKDKDKNALKKSIKDEGKKERNKDDKVRIIKTSKDDSKKNSYHEDKPKDKQSDKPLDRSGGDKELKVEKKEKEKKHKEEKKSKSKEKHKNNEKKENIEVKEYADRTEKIFGKDDFKEEKKYHKIVEEKEEKIEKVSKEKGVEPKNLFSANNANNVDQTIVNNGDNTRKEEKHKHHKHKKDKSKKDSKREKEERKEKKEIKESKEKPPPPPPPVEVARSTPKSDSPKQMKKPLNRLFDELSDKSDSDISSLDDEPITRVLPKDEPDSPDIDIVKEEPITYVKHEEQTKEEKFESGSGKKKKKSSEDRENKKRKRKSKDKEEATNKMIKYENSPEAVKQNSVETPERASEHRPKSVSPASETKFTDEYITKLKELQRKIMTLEDNSGLQQIVQVVAETGQYEITTKTFDFDLCTLDESIVQRLLDFFVP